MLIYDLNDIKNNPFSRLTVYSAANIFHRHTFFEFALVLRGSSSSTINGTPIRTLSRGDIIFVRPCDFHAIQACTQDYMHRDFYVTKEKMKSICATFSDTFYEELMSPQQKLYHKLTIEEFSFLEKKADIFERPLTDPMDNNTERELNIRHTALITQLLDSFAGPQTLTKNNMPEWLHNLFVHLSSFEYISLNVDQIVKTTGYSYSYVYQMFKKYYNMTIHDCLNRSKILLSTSLLGQEKITDIAVALGWENPKNYTIAFKKVFGITPKEYIDSNKKMSNQIYYVTTPPLHSVADLENYRLPIADR